MDPFPLRRANRVIGQGMDVTRRADHSNDIRADGRRLGAGQRALAARPYPLRPELQLLAMAVYPLIGTPWAPFVAT